MRDYQAPTPYRSVFLSDIHLGTRGCQAELLLDFLRHLDGRLEILHWATRRSWSMIERARRFDAPHLEMPEPLIA